MVRKATNEVKTTEVVLMTEKSIKKIGMRMKYNQIVFDAENWMVPAVVLSLLIIS
jgi:hypothetical protein